MFVTLAILTRLAAITCFFWRLAMSSIVLATFNRCLGGLNFAFCSLSRMCFALFPFFKCCALLLVIRLMMLAVVDTILCLLARTLGVHV